MILYEIMNMKILDIIKKLLDIVVIFWVIINFYSIY